jgi:CRP/FNR family cyclic AMP-dependent transcriptional regulator
MAFSLGIITTINLLSRSKAMGCLCEELAGKDAVLSPTCIGHLWIFKNLLPEELDALSKAALRKKYERGQAIFQQGDPAKEMFLVKAGRVKLSKVMADGAEITLDIRKAGDFLGENMLSEDMDYPVTAWCMEDTLFCGFSKEEFEKLV